MDSCGYSDALFSGVGEESPDTAPIFRIGNWLSLTATGYRRCKDGVSREPMFAHSLKPRESATETILPRCLRWGKGEKLTSGQALPATGECR